MHSSGGEIPARILIVDDQRVHRDKLTLAVRALGHRADAVDGGAVALDRLSREPFDLVLLDILMPDMDGFEVMRFMQRDKQLQDIPIIVVSALESDMGSVVRAVDMGADDMLPKRFDGVLLAARLDNALERRRNNAREREHHRHMRKLGDAAVLLESRAVLPDALPLTSTCQRSDAIGRLARVFVQMASEIHRRDASLSHQVDLLRTAGLALATAVVLGLALPLSQMAMQRQSHPLGIALWLAALVAIVCLPVAVWRGCSPRRFPALLPLAAVVGGSIAFAGALPLLWLQLDMSPVVLVGVLPATAAMSIGLRALVTRTVPSRARQISVLLGLLAVAALYALTMLQALPWRIETLTIALLAPVGWAVAGLAASVDSGTRTRGDSASTRDPVRRLTDSVDAQALVGLAAVLGGLMLMPFAWLTDDLVMLFPGRTSDATEFGLLIVMLGIVLVVGATLALYMTRSGDTDSAGAASLAVAFSTIAWSVLTLDSPVPGGIWIPLALFALAVVGRVLSGLNRPSHASVGSSAPDVDLG